MSAIPGLFFLNALTKVVNFGVYFSWIGSQLSAAVEGRHSCSGSGGRGGNQMSALLLLSKAAQKTSAQMKFEKAYEAVQLSPWER